MRCAQLFETDRQIPMKFRNTRKMGALFLCMLLLVIGDLAFCQSAGSPTPERYGLSQRLRNLSDLQPINQRMDLTRLAKTEVLLYWLAREQDSPTKTYSGLGGGPIDTQYIQAQIIGALSIWGDVAALDSLLAIPGIKPAVRDAVRVSLGVRGDTRQADFLMHTAKVSSNPRMRASAVTALGLLGDSTAIPILEDAKKDPFLVMVLDDRDEGQGKGRRTIYPVREAADEARRMLLNPDSLRESEQRRKRFVSDMAEGRKDPEAHRVAPWVLEAISIEAMRHPAAERVHKLTRNCSARMSCSGMAMKCGFRET